MAGASALLIRLDAAEQDGVEQEFERAPGLRAVLRAKAEEHHAPLAYAHVNQRRLAGDELRAEQPAGAQRVAGDVTRDGPRALRVGDLERKGADQSARPIGRRLRGARVYARLCRARPFRRGPALGLAAPASRAADEVK